eukprot:702134-Pleurochrysis_carterae.AAC.4
MDGSGKQEAVNFNTVAAASAAVREKGAVRMMTSANSPISAENSAGAGSPSSNSNVRQDCQGKTSARHKLFGFAEARKMARMMGLSSKKEWDDYSCPGACMPRRSALQIVLSYHLIVHKYLTQNSACCMSPRGHCCQVVRLCLCSSCRMPLCERRPILTLQDVRWSALVSILVCAHARRWAIRPQAISVVDATYREYARNEDTRLPAQPQIIYKDEWQGWGHFLGRAVRA